MTVPAAMVLVNAGVGSREALIRAAADSLGCGRIRSLWCPASGAAMGVLAECGNRADAEARAQRVTGELHAAGISGVTLAVTPPGHNVPLARIRPAFPTRWLRHTADEAFVVTAADEADVMAAAAEAMCSLVVNPRTVTPVAWLPVTPASPPPTAADERLHAWLSEVLWLTDARRFAVRRAVYGGHDRWRGALLGEPLDPGRHEVHGAIKAVTWHALAVNQGRSGRWRARVVVDV